MYATISLYIAYEVVTIKNIKRILFILLIFLLFNIQVSAHPGRTDSAGGHNDNINGGYHYHHGMPEHQHSNGVCPYNVDEASPAEKNEDSESYIGYIFLALLFFGAESWIRWEIKERFNR